MAFYRFAVAGAGAGADSTRKYADKISNKAQKTCRKLGIAFLAAASLTTVAAAGKSVYDDINAQMAAHQQAAAVELAAPRAQYTLDCSLTEKAVGAFNGSVQNGGSVTIQKGACTFSPAR